MEKSEKNWLYFSTKVTDTRQSLDALMQSVSTVGTAKEVDALLSLDRKFRKVIRSMEPRFHRDREQAQYKTKKWGRWGVAAMKLGYQELMVKINKI